jgi:hypothetical protein
MAVLIEKAAAKRLISSRSALIIAFVNISMLVLAPSIAVMTWDSIALGSSMMVMTLMSIGMMKLTSYAHINYLLRERYNKKLMRRQALAANAAKPRSSPTPTNFSIVGGDLVYPHNISVHSMCWYHRAQAPGMLSVD